MFFKSEQTDLKFITKEKAYNFLKNTPKLSKTQKRDISNNKELHQDYEFLVIFPDKLNHEILLKAYDLNQKEINYLIDIIPESELTIYRTQKNNLPNNFFGFNIDRDVLNAMIESKSVSYQDIDRLFNYGDIIKILNNYSLDYNFIKSHFYDLNMTEIYKTQNLITFAHKHCDRVNWKKMSKYQKIPAILCKKVKSVIHWKIFNCDHFSEASKIEFKNYINWNIQDIDLLSEDTIIKLHKENYISDKKIAHSKNENLILGILNEKQLSSNISNIFSIPRSEFMAIELSVFKSMKNSKLFWNKVSEIELSENAINFFGEFINIKSLPNYNIYSDNFIDENKNKIDWDKFSQNTNIINVEFFKKFSKYINWDKLFENPHFPDNLRLIFKNKVNVDYLNTFDNEWFKKTKKCRADILSRYYTIKNLSDGKNFNVISFVDDYKKTKLMINHNRSFNSGTRSHFEKDTLFEIESNIDNCFLNKDYTLRITNGTITK